MPDVPTPDPATDAHHPNGPPESRPARVQRMARRLGIGAALIAAAVAVLLIAAGYRAHNDAHAEIRAEAEAAAETLAGHTARFIEAADLMLDRLRQIGEETDWSDPARPAQLAAELRRLRNFLPPVLRLGLWDGKGQRLTSTEDDLPAGINVADRPYFIAHTTRLAGTGAGGLAISTPMASQVDGSSILVLSRRLSRPDGSFAGVASLSFNPEELSRQPAQPRQGGPLAVRWMRDDGQPLATGGYGPAEGDEMLVRRAGAYPLLVGVTVPERMAHDRWLAMVYPYLALGLVVLFGFGAGAWMLLRWASAENAYRGTLAALATRLRRSNAELEERVEQRTRALSETVAQRDLLLKEVNHRLKNSLQLACALVQMQGQTVAAPEVRQQLADTVARLQAIARVHDQLYRTEDVRRVAAADYLRTLCANLEQSALASERFWRVVVAADPVDLPTDQAVPVGLLVNELVTNALKHGQPATHGGEGWTVEVGLARLGDGRVRLTVRDHGAGLPGNSLPRKDGSLGMKLLTGLTRQLGATLTVEDAAPGARFVVLFQPQPLD